MRIFGKKKDEGNIYGEEIEEIKKRVKDAELPEYAKEVLTQEVTRLEKTDPSTPEYIISISYIDFVLSLPWNHFTEDNLDIKRAKEILDTYHHGLDSIKERILDYLAVRNLCYMRAFRVLVVDDEKTARENIRYALEKEGYEIETAKSGFEALEILDKKEFNVLLTDLKMEAMDGIELMKHAKRITPDIETIIFTGYATIESAIDAMKEGAVNYFSKPINLNELKGLIRDIKERKRVIRNLSGPILCFSGPPGTGKTSVGRAISEALGRRFTRISLAGLRDEAELRGHRRTYVGAMPGRIINEIKRLGVGNPLFMLDELDKIAQEFKGDPVSILLEILDAEQNREFIDYYLDMPFDLSPVMFIVTANGVEDLPEPLKDRLEVIEFSGYSEKEKMSIAKEHIVPRQLSLSGLGDNSPSFSDEAIKKIIREYTREAGVRNLEREISTVCRRIARKMVESKGEKLIKEIGPEDVERLLGPRKYRAEQGRLKNRIGVATGLVGTEFGGELIFVESSIMPGIQQLIMTGSLGNIIKESAQTALSYIRSQAEDLGIQPDFYKDKDIHIHIPAGATPKDGPSAGLAIALALLSLLTKRPARVDVAITGELTLIGQILPVSAVKEKLLAAQRTGIKKVIFPEQNRIDIENMPNDVIEGLKIITAKELPEVIDIVLEPGS